MRYSLSKYSYGFENKSARILNLKNIYSKDIKIWHNQGYLYIDVSDNNDISTDVERIIEDLD